MIMEDFLKSLEQWMVENPDVVPQHIIRDGVMSAGVSGSDPTLPQASSGSLIHQMFVSMI